MKPHAKAQLTLLLLLKRRTLKIVESEKDISTEADLILVVVVLGTTLY